MTRPLTKNDLDIVDIDGKKYIYIKPEIGDFNQTRTISDRTIIGDKNFILGTGKVLVEDHTAIDNRIGIRLNAETDVRVYDYQFLGPASPTAYASGIYRSPSHDGSAEFLRIYGDGEVNPPKSSKLREVNSDFVDNNTREEADGGAMYFRDVTIKNFGDSAFDGKSNVYIMNATIDNTFQALRAQGGSTIIIVNSVINAPDNGLFIKLTGEDSRVLFYNTLWNGKDRPDASKIGTWQVPNDKKAATIARNVVELDENPLPAIDDFFSVDKAKYFAQVSVNGGDWVDVALANRGQFSTHVGDTLSALPDLGAGQYRIRAWTVEDGVASDPVVSDAFSVTRAGVAGGPQSGGSQGGTGGVVPQDDPDDDDGAPDGGGGSTPVDPVTPSLGATLKIVADGADLPGGGKVLVGSKVGDLVITTAGSDLVSTIYGNDVIQFDTRADIGDDVIVDFNRTRDKLLFTEFVDLGADDAHKLDAQGRFVLDDPSLDANGGSIALGSALAGRWVHFSGETEDGMFVYEIWNRPWSELG